MKNEQSVHKNIVIVTHKFVTHPDDELIVYLNERNTVNVLHICHSFSDAPDRRSYYIWYKKGKKYKEKRTTDYSFLPLPLLYLKEMIYTLWWVYWTRVTWDSYIGMDGLCVLFGNFLKKVGKVKRTIYWAIDFVPANRFSSAIANNIYHKINIHGYKNSDEMWDLSPRMVEAREKFLRINKSDYKYIQVVQYGMWVDRIKKYTYEECDKDTLVFMGHLRENQGVQLVLQAMPEILKVKPRFTFKVIGTGPYKEELEKLATKLKIANHCNFMGKITDHRELENEIAKSCVAIAPYIKKLDKWTYYADPGKIKTYLACGVPVLLTDLSWNAKEIVEKKCGAVVEEKKGDIIRNVLLLMNKLNNSKYRKNAAIYSKEFDYSMIFSKVIL